MSTSAIVLAFVLPLLALAAALFVCYKTMKNTGSAKKAFQRNLLTLAVALVLCCACTGFVSAQGTQTDAADAAQAQPAVAAATDSGAGLATGLGFLGASLAIGLAAVGAGIALSAGAPAAIGAVAEDPKSFGKSMIFVALGEAIAIYGFIIAFLMILKIPNLPTL